MTPTWAPPYLEAARAKLPDAIDVQADEWLGEDCIYYGVAVHLPSGFRHAVKWPSPLEPSPADTADQLLDFCKWRGEA